MRSAEGHILAEEGTLWVQATKPPARFDVTCDGDGIAGHAGAALLMEVADRLGLTRALGWRAGRTQTSRHRHDAGSVLRDLAMLLADGRRLLERSCRPTQPARAIRPGCLHANGVAGG